MYNLFNKYGLENCKLELIELALCNTLMELGQKWGYAIKSSECVNKVTPGRTLHGYRIDNNNVSKEKEHLWSFK